jgi:cyclopropane-fatty-acyl-phospholipid synthase
VLERTLEHLITEGGLTVIEPSGRRRTFGDRTDTSVVVRIRGQLTPLKLALRPDLYLGEAYVDGLLDIEHGSLWDLLDLIGRNLARRKPQNGFMLRPIKSIARYFHQVSSVRTAKTNVARHYDLSYDMYRRFLDRDLQYSCAYFGNDTMSLDDAQAAKKRHIMSKLLLKRGQKIPDIGCGWGGLALSLAQSEDVEVTGITLSKEQCGVARKRAKSLGLDRRVKFSVQDYREITGKFDRIVSVGMFEHADVPQYGEFFRRVAGLLEDDGVALVHAIGRSSGPDVTSAWIRKYIFPGGYIPALSQVWPAVERTGFWVTDLEILRLHYAETLRAWRQRFITNFDGKTIRDLRFRRMWEFYLAISEMSFRYGSMMVFQMQLTRRIDALPSTRDYMFEFERRSQGLLAAE